MNEGQLFETYMRIGTTHLLYISFLICFLFVSVLLCFDLSVCLFLLIDTPFTQ